MKFLHKYGTRSIEVRRARRELYFRLAMATAVVVFFAIMLLVTRFRPRLDDAAADNLPQAARSGDTLANPRLVELRGEVDALVAEFASRKAADGVELDDLQLLEQAMNLQRDVIRSRGSDIAPKADLDRLETLQSLHDEEMGNFLMAQSLRLDDQADAAWASGDQHKAIELLQSALRLQTQINNDYPLSSHRNPSRLYQLGNKELLWKTKPLADEADRLREQALQLVLDKQYAAARRAIQQALELQQTLNRDFRNSRLASISRLKEFEEAHRFVENAEDTDRVQQLLGEGRRALEAGQYEAAISQADQAQALQQAILARSPATRDSAAITLAQIRKLKDTAASIPIHNRILQLREETRLALRQRNVDQFRRLVGDWLRESLALSRGFPDSDLLAGLDSTEVSFLNERKDEIPTILQMVYNNLIPVPGEPGLQMFATEVSQALYSSVTGSNPSNLRLPANPVESVSWQEAQDFLAHLAWILVRPVALPTREAYLSAVGQVRLEDLAAQSWSSENSNREPQPVGRTSPNAAGFQDLLGNVAEWLASPQAVPDQVTAIGGSARDARIRLLNLPEEPRAPSERNRFVGFRFVVTTGE